MLKRTSLLALLLLLCLGVSVSAQSTTLTLGQPVIIELDDDSDLPRYSYTLASPSAITLRAISETIHPTITITRGDEIVAQEANASGALVVVLNTFLDQGSYTVEIGTANDETGTIVLLVENETPVTVTDLSPGVAVNGEVSTSAGIALYRLSTLSEPSHLYVQSGNPSSGVTVTLVNEASNQPSGMLSGELLGGRFDIPAGGFNYRLEVEYTGSAAVEPFTVCWVAVSIGGCGGAQTTSATVIPTAQPVATECMLRPSSGSVNVRASASTDAPILASLQAGIEVPVLGIAPNRSFYNIQLGNVNGWVAASVAAVSGNCDNLTEVEPPDFVPVATAAPTLAPAPTNLPQPTQAQQPTQQPTQVPTASGPCLLTINSPVNVYTQPTAQVDFLFDQVQSGELIPTGRLADNSWWQTSYAGAWVQTGLFGGAITQSGNCALPVVSP